jgi:hypothetical protein
MEQIKEAFRVNPEWKTWKKSFLANGHFKGRRKDVLIALGLLKKKGVYTPE